MKIKFSIKLLNYQAYENDYEIIINNHKYKSGGNLNESIPESIKDFLKNQSKFKFWGFGSRNEITFNISNNNKYICSYLDKDLGLMDSIEINSLDLLILFDFYDDYFNKKYRINEFDEDEYFEFKKKIIECKILLLKSK